MLSVKTGFLAHQFFMHANKYIYIGKCAKLHVFAHTIIFTWQLHPKTIKLQKIKKLQITIVDAFLHTLLWVADN